MSSFTLPLPEPPIATSSTTEVASAGDDELEPDPDRASTFPLVSVPRSTSTSVVGAAGAIVLPSERGTQKTQSGTVAPVLVRVHV